MTAPRRVGLEPARLAFDAAGTPRADSYDDVYHSIDGGPGQSQHVFLAGNGLPQRWRGRRNFTIVETGFGLGLNFLATWEALRNDASAPGHLHYVSVEKHPLTRDDLARVHVRWPQFAVLTDELQRQWPPLVRGFHRLELDGGRIVLTLLLGDAAELLSELDARADAIFLDGFAPEKNPQMWSEQVLRELARLCVHGTTAATWTVAGQVRERLTRIGFRTDKRAGYGRKREMLRAEFAGDESRTSARDATDRRAIIVGAGVAGAWCAHALARRGWRIDLIERHARVAQEASGNAVGVVRPALNLADNENARLARAAFLLAARKLQTHPDLERAWKQTGVLHLATDGVLAERMARILTTHAFPDDYARWVDADEAVRLASQEVVGPGWWIPLGGWCRPAALCDALLALAGDRVTRRFGQTAAAVTRTAEGWRVDDPSGESLARAPVVILANAYDVASITGAARLPLVQVRGQVSHLPQTPERRLEIVVCGDGYVAPLPGGGHCVGATFQPDDTDDRVRAEDHTQNLARLHRMLPGFASQLRANDLDGRAAIRTTTPDRLPACGPLATDAGEGLHVVTGLGARGLIWAPLCAEVLAAHLEDEPNPIERSLIEAVMPGRLSRSV